MFIFYGKNTIKTCGAGYKYENIFKQFFPCKISESVCDLYGERDILISLIATDYYDNDR